ncbi:hypothetical protein SAMN04487993_102943 [Salipiger marinus]|uniref:Uncharacterized protein n=1 Tax=Salipiger marinus TaxID=555512 RepID=A0A1G8TEN2_9RHOB|nr:hypothetical protein SAMN04487993_102943 [Salipiger marinus]
MERSAWRRCRSSGFGARASGAANVFDSSSPRSRMRACGGAPGGPTVTWSLPIPCRTRPKGRQASASQCRLSLRFRSWPAACASSRPSISFWRGLRGWHMSLRCCFSHQFGAPSSLCRSGARGSDQPKRRVRRSSTASQAARLAGPGGSGLKARSAPSGRATQRGRSMFSSSRFRCVCVVMNGGGRKRTGTPAKPISRQSASARLTAPRKAGSPALNWRVSMSSAAKDSTAERYFRAPGASRIAARAIAGSPRRISGGGSRRKRRGPVAAGLRISGALI